MTYINLCAAVSVLGARLALLIVIAVNLHASCADAQTAHSSSKLSIDDGRPVAKAVEELVARYGYVITYEDPRFAYEGDLQDVTTQVRRDLDRYPPGKAPKVIVPRGGKLAVTLPFLASVNTQAIASVLDQLVRAQSIRGEGGRFRVVQVGDVFHVVPTEVRNRKGNWIAQSSILDIPISLPMEDRSEGGMLAAIVNAVSAEAHVKVLGGGVGGIGGGLANPNRPASYHLGADNERARDVLMRALVLLNDPKAGTWYPQKLKWQLFYGSEDNLYFLNIEGVPDRATAPVPTKLPKPSTDSSLSGTSVLSILRVHRGYSRRESFYVAIRSLEEWNRLSSLHADSHADALVPQPPPAEVDFDHSTLLVANAGVKHSFPVEVVFNSVFDAGSEIRVRVTVTGPGTCPGFPDEGSVSAMALIPRTDKPIQFDVSNIDRDCTRR